MSYPDLPNNIRKYQSEVVAIRGLNLSDNTQDGDLCETRNISCRRYPYFATRRARSKLTPYANATAITAWEKLVVVQGTNLLYDGAVVGQVAEGAKQFAVVNTKLVIWPDKKYLDIKTLTVQSLTAEASGAGAKFEADSITVTGWSDLTTQFKVGDTISVSGCTVQTGNNKNAYIKAVEAGKITVTSNCFTAATETATITLARSVPDLDFICESENRLWGCCNADKTIYASALGDPTNFFTYEGISTDSYAVAVGSEGNFTGCAKLSTSVLFWKETVLHKMLGSYPAEYALYTYNVEGLQAGCHKSMQVVNETLFYKGLHGIYAYSGGIPALVSRQFGDHEFTDAVGGTDGVRYFLSVKEGARSRLLAYDIQDGIWLEEDTTAAVDFARIGKDMYFLDSSGSVYLADTGEEDASIEWLMEFVPFYATINYRKRIRKLFLRVTVPAGAWLRVEARFDSGVWCEVGKIAGGPCDDVFTMPVQIARCDKFGLRVSGVGPCCLLGLSREFSLGSDK